MLLWNDHREGGAFCYSIGRDCKQTKNKKKIEKYTLCWSGSQSVYNLPRDNNHFQTHKNHCEPAEELCMELVSDLYYALILNGVCNILRRNSSVLYCRILHVRVNQRRGKATEGALGLNFQTEVNFLCWLRAGLVRERHHGQPSTSSSSSLSSSSLCLVFAFLRKRDLVGYRRAHCGHAPGHDGGAALHEPHPHRGHRGHGRLGDLQALAAHPDSSAHRGPDHTLGDVEEASGDPPHHPGRRRLFVLAGVWKRGRKQKGGRVKPSPVLEVQE